MFTGIIEEIGIVKSIEKKSVGITLGVEANKILKGSLLGDSISIQGVCQTVTEISENTFKVDVSEETLEVTNFKNLKIGDNVNLERALTLNSRLGGHIVSGHIEGLGILKYIENLSSFYNLTFQLPENLTKYVVHKGSITVNGISLTVAKINEDIFTVAIIPHTFNNTTLKYLKIGDKVNIETDIIAKYIEKMLVKKEDSSKIDIDFLRQNGFA